MTDEWGLTLPNNLLELFFPVYNQSLVLLVKYRHNPTQSRINYGPLPTTTTDAFSIYNGIAGGTGGAAVASADGEFPATSWIKNKQFDVTSTFYVEGTFPWGNNDIWYTQVPTRLFEVRTFVTPGFLRVSVDIPTGQVQESLQDQVSGGVDQDFGWSRGKAFAVHIPNVHYGYAFGNDSNLAMYTRALFRYAEQEVALVQDPSVVFGVMTGQIPAHRVTMPVNSSNASLEGAIRQTYGFQGKGIVGFPVLPMYQRQAAITEYSKLLAANPLVRGGQI